MVEKTSFRNYVNPGPKGSRFTAAWQAEYLPDGETYTEDKSGKVIAALIRSVRKGDVVRVRRLFCLAPWRGSPRKRREALGERIDAIEAAGGRVFDAENGAYASKRLLLLGYDDIATAGRALAKRRTGRPAEYDFTAQQWDVIGGIWTSRKHKNDPERIAAIRVKAAQWQGVEPRLAKVPGRTTLRNKFGSPHKGRDET